jgi:hypothetical protein
LRCCASARLTLASTELRAPATGIVVSVNGHRGETPGQTTASAGANSGNGGNAFITMITFDPEE